MAAGQAAYGWYGDDFTGATDTLAVLAQAGLRAMLFPGVPTAEQLAAAGPLDAIGIAGAARAMAREAMAAELEPVGRFFAAAGVRVLHYKCCSTFDSAPEIGSIGEGVRVLGGHMANPLVPIIGGQPNLGRYCVFSNLFAQAGSGGEVHRIDRHPTMSVHPVTPMRESDLRRHLAAQGLEGIAAIHYPAYAQGQAALEAIAGDHLRRGGRGLLLDITGPADLVEAGRLIRRAAQNAPLLAVGASSVAQAVTGLWTDVLQPALGETSLTGGLRPADGPVFLMVGSLSPVTRRQVEAAPSYMRFWLDVDALIEREPSASRTLAEATEALAAGRHVMVVTNPPSGHAAAALAPRVAEATAGFVAEVLREARPSRLGIAGGDTSSQAVKALGLWGLSYLTALSPGVAVCRVHADDPRLAGLEVMLKGGQMGPVDLFERLVSGAAS